MRLRKDGMKTGRDKNCDTAIEAAAVLMEAAELTVPRARVLIVDDHPTMRQMIRLILKGYADIDVVGEGSNGLEAVAAIEIVKPSVVLIDINMPRMNGIEATRALKTRYPTLTIIGLTVNMNDEYCRKMKDAGATTLLRKDAAVEELYEAIQIGLRQACGLGMSTPSPSKRQSSKGAVSG